MASRRKAKRSADPGPEAAPPSPGKRRRPAAEGEAPPTPGPPPSPEVLARRTLAWGAGLLILGLAVVGIRHDDDGLNELGVVPALAGLLLLVYGIHTFGRLGPEDEAPASEGNDADRAERAAWWGIWLGGLIAAAGVAVTFGSAGSHGWAALVAYAAVFAGGFRLLQGLSGLKRMRKG
jgi:hypothetical protein